MGQHNDPEVQMAETMILIPGRSKKQGTTLNQGKLEQAYIDTVSTVDMNQDDMERLGLKDGDRIRLSNATGTTIVSCRSCKSEDLPDGTLFIPYGPPSSQLMESDTAGSGMPISKHIRVSIEKLNGADHSDEDIIQ